MLAACVALAISVLPEYLIEHSDDPFVILWARLVKGDEASVIKGLAAYGSQKAIPPLRAFLKDENSIRRDYSAFALVQLGIKDKEVFAVVSDRLLRFENSRSGPHVLGDGDIGRMIDFTLWTTELGQRLAPAVPDLVKFISDCPNDEGGSTAVVLSEIAGSGRKVIDAIIKLAARVRVDDSFGDRGNPIAVYGAIATFGPTAKAAVPLLERQLSAVNPLLAVHFATVLLKVDPGNRKAIDYLTRQALSDNAQARGMVADYLSMNAVNHDESLPLMQKLATAKNVARRDSRSVCEAAVKLALNDDVMIAALKKRLSNHDQRIASDAAFAIAQLRPRDSDGATSVLGSALASKDEQVVNYAADYCARLSTPSNRLAPVLKRRLKYPDLGVASNCAKTLLRIDPEDKHVHELVIRLLREEFPDRPDDFFFHQTDVARACAVGIIQRSGSSFKDTRKDLISLLRHANYCRDVVIAIKGIDAAEEKPNNNKSQKP
jgi:HEAT repeat protein